MKIVYCTDNLCYLGGIQRVTAEKANQLSLIPGNEVWIIVADNRKPIVFPIIDKVHIISLDINYSADDWKGKWYILKNMLIKRNMHKKKLSQTLAEIQPDIIISTGTSEKLFLPHIKINSNPVYIREMHFYKNYRKASCQSKIQYIHACISDFFDYKIHISSYDKVVVLTQQDKTEYWNNNEKVIVIPNPCLETDDTCCDYSAKVVASAGRLSTQKNFHELIQAWKIVHTIHPDWLLYIWGEGSERESLNRHILSAELQKTVFLKGFTNHLEKELLKASVFALTSNYEGWGLVLVEAMAKGLPVVSYHCPCGPKDIITDGKDGFLVETGNNEQMAQRLCQLIGDVELRTQMGQKAKEAAKQYTAQNIIPQWMQLFYDLVKNKHRCNNEKI